MPIDLKRLQVRLRRISWIVAAMGFVYLYVRYDTRTLPEGGCSPLVRFAAGDVLLLDTRPAGYAVGDALLFNATVKGANELLMGKVQRVAPEGSTRAGALQVWVVTDAVDCPGEDSTSLGWIDRERCRARILFAWPW